MKAITVILLSLLWVPMGHAQAGPAVRAATELGEVLLRRGGSEAAQELAKSAVRRQCRN